jgi:hypothetical protein
MNYKYKNLTVIIPSTRGVQVTASIKSVLVQKGFSSIEVVISGKNTLDESFRNLIQSEFNEGNVHIAKCRISSVILPGEARNDGLRYITQNNLNPEFLLFLDDDVTIPTDYCLILADYIEKNNTCAVMGRLSSVPVNLWTMIVDYSNFWWLQVREDVPDMQWLATAAALTKWDYIQNVVFHENITTNEDVLFFNEIVKNTGRSRSICSQVTAEHHHSRKNLWGVLEYQFRNGKAGVLFEGNGLNIKNTIRDIRENFKSARNANREFLNNHKFVLWGVLVSFIVFQIGIEYGHLSKFDKRVRK